MIEKDPNRSIKMNGLIIPTQWDQHGNVKGIAIACFDETNYPILLDKVGKNLLALMHKEVEISGNFTKIDNSDIIRVRKFQVSKKQQSGLAIG